jgi:hypothetical protein
MWSTSLRSGKPDTVDASASERCGIPVMAVFTVLRQIWRVNFPRHAKKSLPTNLRQEPWPASSGDMAPADPLAHSLRVLTNASATDFR